MVGEVKMSKLGMHANFTVPSSFSLTNHSSLSIYTLHCHTQKYRSDWLLEGLLVMYYTSLRSPLRSSDIGVDYCNKFSLYSFPATHVLLSQDRDKTLH
jgi:hypothetical protein